MSTLGIDIGTTGCKAVVFDDEGRKISSSYREYPILAANPGWAELNSVQVCSDCFTVIQEAAAAATGDPVTALAISCQGEAFTPVDARGAILGNAMVSSDSRAAALTGPWSETFGREKLYQITGHTPHPLFTLYKLLWLRDNAPDTWGKADKFLCMEDLLQQRLGVDSAISWSLAGRTMLFDVRKHEWHPDIMGALGLDPTRLAKPLASGSVVGTIPDEIAGPLGLAEGAVVVTGAHDQVACALGCGVTTPGSAMYSLGTVECVAAAFDEPVFNDSLFKSNLCTYDHAVPGLYATLAYTLTGGNLLKWFRDEWAREEMRQASETGRDVYDILLVNMPAAPTDLMVLPHFTPTATPWFDPDSTGAILGLRLTHTRNDILRALLEGVAFEIRLNLDVLERSGIAIDELRAVGGGAKSRTLLQLKADVLNKPIKVVAVSEGGCLGAAILARAAVTGETPTAVMRRWVRETDVILPDPASAAIYTSRFATYQKLYPAMKALRD